MSDIVQRELDRRIREGVLAPDPEQIRVAAALDRLAEQLRSYTPRPEQGWRRLLGNGRPKAPRGLYIHGGVGRGKTMLVDLFHQLAPTRAKRRAHFHEFMRDVHARIRAIRQQQRTGHVWEDADPIRMAAEQIAAESHLLCFDEFQVTDIADAMILGRLFEALLANGVVIVATSNTAPSDLYRDGLNRGAFAPFIALIEDRVDTILMDGQRDYRQNRLKGRRVYVSPLGEAAREEVGRLWTALTDTEKGEPATLTVLGRTLRVPEASRGVARFSFADLCGAPLGAADYLAIAEAFHTVFVTDVPRLSRDRHDQARRFVNLIDTLYEKGTRLVMSAESAPEEIYVAGEGDAAFARAASRLSEMQSSDYWDGAGRRPAA